MLETGKKIIESIFFSLLFSKLKKKFKEKIFLYLLLFGGEKIHDIQ